MCGGPIATVKLSQQTYMEFSGVWEMSAVISHVLHELIYVKYLWWTHLWWTALVMQWLGYVGAHKIWLWQLSARGFCCKSHFQERFI